MILWFAFYLDEAGSEWDACHNFTLWWLRETEIRPEKLFPAFEQINVPRTAIMCQMWIKTIKSQKEHNNSNDKFIN